MVSTDPSDLGTVIGANLPYLRRYARAITGSQDTGDNYAAATLEAIIADRGLISAADTPKIALFRTFHAVWTSAGAPMGEPDTPLSAAAQSRMARLTSNTREVLLLHTIEEFSPSEVGAIVDLSEPEVRELIEVARREMAEGISGDVLIIEDEAIITLDLQAIVEEMGQRVSGVATTRAEAVARAEEHRPDLILADIQLADNSSGIDAVNDILAELGSVPIIFITAFPERLLTGEKPEPAFLITKPFTEDQVRSAVSQAMFFSSTETLRDGGL